MGYKWKSVKEVATVFSGIISASVKILLALRRHASVADMMGGSLCRPGRPAGWLAVLVLLLLMAMQLQ